MAQTFPPVFDLYVKAFGLLVVLGLLSSGLIFYLLNRSPYWTNVGVTKDQPVPFSHEHHVSELGIDCRFCHRSVATSSYAGMPDTQTCMTCHSQIWTQAPMLAPVRQSYEKNESLRWNRINELPQFVYFNHSIHINKGVGCTSCHGRIDQMQITYKAVAMEMQWCLSCHRHPAENLRPLSQIYKMDWTKPSAPKLGEALMVQRQIHTDHLANCSACHR